MQNTSHQARQLNVPKAPSQKERIFLHLLSAGPLTAKELSGTTQLQVTTVYARLNDLKRGFYHKGASYEAYEQEIINGEIRWGIRFQVRQFSEIERIEQKIKYLTEKLDELKRTM
jgi:sugar-specific transcriptional regulator TrmB